MASGRPTINQEEITYADDGHKELVEILTAPIFAQDGVLIGVLGVARDIAERKQHEAFSEFQARRAEALLELPGAAESMNEDDFYIGLRSKLMGQVNLVRVGQDHLNSGGSFTLTTGILADHPVALTTSAAMVNGAIHSFVKAAAIELKNGIRINAVSSGLVEDAVEKYEDYFPGHNPIPMKKVVNGYAKSVRGKETGKIIKMYDNC